MEQGNGRFNTISRTAAFSRMLSLFGSTSTTGWHARNCARSPAMHPARPRAHDHLLRGDGVFVVGAWDDVIDPGSSFGSGSTNSPRANSPCRLRHRHVPDKHHLRDGPRSLRSRRRGEVARQERVVLDRFEFTFGWDELLSKVIEESTGTSPTISVATKNAHGLHLQAARTTRRTRRSNHKGQMGVPRACGNPIRTQRLFSSLLTGYTMVPRSDRRQATQDRAAPYIYRTRKEESGMSVIQDDWRNRSAIRGLPKKRTASS